MNVIIKRRVGEQELVDLALDLHTRYPHNYFEILDDQTRLRDFEQAADLVSAERRLGTSRLKALVDSLKPWEEKHWLATIGLFAEDGAFKWELVGADAHPAKANERICDLDAKTLSFSECVPAAGKRVPN